MADAGRWQLEIRCQKSEVRGQKSEVRNEGGTADGELKEKHGLTMFGDTPPGTCPDCGVAHDPGQPHDRQSLTWQYRYYDRHGRFPTWVDAMAHCAPEVKGFWAEALKGHGVDVATESGVAIDEIVVNIEVGWGDENV